MGIDLSNSDSVKKTLKPHVGHAVEVAHYGNRNDPVDVVIECISCGEVLLAASSFAHQQVGRTVRKKGRSK